MSNNQWIGAKRGRAMELTVDSVVPILSLLSLVDCFIPALGAPYQCVVVFFLASFSSCFKHNVQIPRKSPWNCSNTLWAKRRCWP